MAAAPQKEIYNFAKPWYRRRTVRIFRDKTSLAASPALWPSLENASEFLILVASPKSAESPWIGREMGWWIANRDVEKLLIVLTHGDIFSDEKQSDFDWERTTALPAALKGRFSNEPLYVDLRWTASGPNEALSSRSAKFREAVLDLTSALRGLSKDELDGEDLRQHKRTRRIAWTVGIGLLALTIAFGAAA